jgi:hypothetical protein
VSGEAWTLVWARIEIERRRIDGHESEPRSLASIEGALENHFTPIQEEIESCPKMNPAPRLDSPCS